MKNLWTFNLKNFIIAIAIFIIEVLIALYIHDNFIRPFFGDFLVVILLYYLVKSFLNLSIKTTAILVLIFSYIVEFLQYFKFVEIIGLQEYKLARIVIGTSFSWYDIIAYTCGIIFVYWIEHKRILK